VTNKDVLLEEQPPIQFNSLAGGIEAATCQATGIVPQSQVLYLQHLRTIHPFGTIIDVGCGGGNWMWAALKLGVKTVQGYDLVPVPDEHLKVARELITITDLSEPLRLSARYDLAVSTEVAEHIDRPRADPFIDNLCAASDVILFSAAFPYQGGVHHRNENWAEYWAEKFYRRGYLCYDIFRPRFWNDPRVHYYYRQNTFLYVHKRWFHDLENKGFSPTIQPRSYVHPELLMQAVNRARSASDRNFTRDVDIYYNYVLRGIQYDDKTDVHAYGQEDLWRRRG
jgi:hypothetical protein